MEPSGYKTHCHAQVYFDKREFGLPVARGSNHVDADRSVISGGDFLPDDTGECVDECVKTPAVAVNGNPVGEAVVTVEYIAVIVAVGPCVKKRQAFENGTAVAAINQNGEIAGLVISVFEHHRALIAYDRQHAFGHSSWRHTAGIYDTAA